MKNIENRVARLEQQLPNNDFLVVFANNGENKDAAVVRVMNENNILSLDSGTFIIYLNLHKTKRIK